MHEYMWRLNHFGCHPQNCGSSPLKQGFSLAGSSPVWKSGCPVSLRDSLVHTISALGLQAQHHALIFRWVLGNQTQFLLLVCSCLTHRAIALVLCQYPSYFSCLFSDALAPSYRKTCLSPLSYSGVLVELPLPRYAFLCLAGSFHFCCMDRFVYFSALSRCSYYFSLREYPYVCRQVEPFNFL